MSYLAHSASAPLVNRFFANLREINWESLGAVYARAALGAAFLSAVAGRFGLWHGTFDTKYFHEFLEYAGQVLSFAPKAAVPWLASAATLCETALGVLLIAGLWPRRVAVASAILLAVFGTSMAISFGLKSPLDYSVFSASSAALLLALDASRREREGQIQK